jgi:hypothetical protein
MHGGANMKKILLVSFSLILIFTLFSCNKKIEGDIVGFSANTRNPYEVVENLDFIFIGKVVDPYIKNQTGSKIVFGMKIEDARFILNKNALESSFEVEYIYANNISDL